MVLVEDAFRVIISIGQQAETLAEFFDTDDFTELKTKPTPKEKNKEKK